MIDIQANLARVRERIARAAERSGRRAKDVLNLADYLESRKQNGQATAPAAPQRDASAREDADV